MLVFMIQLTMRKKEKKKRKERCREIVSRENASTNETRSTPNETRYTPEARWV